MAFHVIDFNGSAWRCGEVGAQIFAVFVSRHGADVFIFHLVSDEHFFPAVFELSEQGADVAGEFLEKRGSAGAVFAYHQGVAVFVVVVAGEVVSLEGSGRVDVHVAGIAGEEEGTDDGHVGFRSFVCGGFGHVGKELNRAGGVVDPVVVREFAAVEA